MKCTPQLVATVAICVGSSVCAATPWFDAGVGDLAGWPDDGGSVVVAGQGVWTHTAEAKLAGEAGSRRLLVDADDSLTFTASERVVNQPVSVSTSMLFVPYEEMPEVDEAAKGALIVFGPEGARAYYGLVARADGLGNEWRQLSGAVPQEASFVTVEATLRPGTDGRTQVRYAVDGTGLTCNGSEWSAIVLPSGETALSGCSYRGLGEVASLSGETETSVPNCVLTIPPLEHVTVAHVQVFGVEVEPDAGGAYSVAQGSAVTVTFAPEAGWALDTPEMSFVLRGYGDLPETGRPVASHVADVVSINEVMAKNGTTLRTEMGYAELDWVELRNTGDSDVDLTGWILFNDPTAKVSKWTSIRGSCVVPAHGYKIVWCDKDLLCPDDGFAPGEAYVRCNISTDAGKHTVFLAPTADKNSIVQQVALPEGIKDISYGFDSGSNGFAYFREPTPGAANTTRGYGPITPAVAFSEPHGYKDGPFSLTITCADAPGAAIHYTTDGSSPTLASARYTGPITIDRTTVIRAGVPDENAVIQRDASATYLYLDDILAQGQDTPANFPADRAVNNHAMRYGLNADYVARNRALIAAGLTNKIATLSVVADPKNLFDATDGVYVNPQNEGRASERMTMIEQIDPRDAANGFSVPAGFRLRGASSRNPDYAKHSLRFFFRSEYGMGSLKFPLFGNEGVGSFDKVDLRTSQNYSWSNEMSDQDTFIHECFSRDSQGAMGVYYTKSRYYNLFINGQYWGLYQTEERGDEDFAESYNGGSAANYDVIKTSQPGNVTGASEGTDEAWRALWDISVNKGVGSGREANYNRLLGLDPDGTRNPDYPILLNPTNLVIYMLNAHYVCDADSPFSVWGGFANNVYAIRNRVDGDGKLDGFYFLRHDAEHSMGKRGECAVDADPTAYGTDGDDSAYLAYDKFNPAELNWRLARNAEYRMLIADLFYRFFLKEGGVMTSGPAKARFRARMDEIDEAVAGECARWSTDVGARNPEAWTNACNACLAFIDQRIPHLLRYYRMRGWYPGVDPATPVEGDDLRFATADGGTVYYTLDGSDPRAAGGTVSALAASAEGGVAIGREDMTITFRTLRDGEWSALDTVVVAGRGFSDWPEDPDAEITDDTEAADLAITAGAFATASPAELRKLSKWAKAHGVEFGGAAVNGMAFGEAGVPATVFEEAYLLNCEPNAQAVAAKKALFRFTEIVPGVQPEITGDFNGRVTVLGAVSLDGAVEWTPNKEGAHFFKATLTR